MGVQKYMKNKKKKKKDLTEKYTKYPMMILF